MLSCRWCGKMLKDATKEENAICGPCMIKEAETYRTLAQAMQKNPGMNAMELATAAKVPLAKVNYFIKIGKIKPR